MAKQPNLVTLVSPSVISNNKVLNCSFDQSSFRYQTQCIQMFFPLKIVDSGGHNFSINIATNFVKEGSLNETKNGDQMILYSGTSTFHTPKWTSMKVNGSSLNNRINNRCLYRCSTPELGSLLDGVASSWGQQFLWAP